MQTLGDVITWTMALVGAVVIPYLILRAWVFPHVRTIGVALTRVWSLLRVPLSPNTIMSSSGIDIGANGPSDWRDQQPTPEGNHLIAMGNNAVNGQVTVNPSIVSPVNPQSDIIPADARELIRFQAKAEAIADLLREGVVTNQAKAIEAVYHCSRTSSSRPDTPYQKARRLIEQCVNPRPMYYDDLRAKVEAEIEAEIEAEAPARGR